MLRLSSILCLTLGFYLSTNSIQAQFRADRIQLHYGMGSQQIFPFKAGSYDYTTQFLKIHLGFPVVEKNKWSFSWNLEPGLYLAKHQLTNEWYKVNERDADYAAKIPEFLEMKRITEYVLNIGFQLNYSLTDQMHLYGLISAGPMYSDTETERLAKGLAFSDIVGIGLNYLHGNISTGIRFSMRHVSNANLQKPNNGHNSSNVEVAIGVLLNQ